MEQPNILEINDAINITDAAKLLNCSVIDLLKKGVIEEILFYVPIKPHSAKLFAPMFLEIKRQGSYQTKSIHLVPLAVAYLEQLLFFDEAKLDQYEASLNGGVLDWHFWHLDEPQLVRVENLFLCKSQLASLPLISAIEPIENQELQETVGKWVKPDNEKVFNLRLETLRRWMTSKSLEQQGDNTIKLNCYPQFKGYSKEKIYSELCGFDNAFLIGKDTFDDFWQEQKLLKFK